MQLPFLSELTFADISFLLSVLVSPPMAPIARGSDFRTQLIDQGPTMGGFQNLLPQQSSSWRLTPINFDIRSVQRDQKTSATECVNFENFPLDTFSM